MLDLNLDLSGRYVEGDQSVLLEWSCNAARLPEGDWYWAVFRRGPGEENFRYYMAVPKEERSYTEHTLKPGEQASYYVRLQFGDGRRSTDSEIVSVTATKKE